MVTYIVIYMVIYIVIYIVIYYLCCVYFSLFILILETWSEPGIGQTGTSGIDRASTGHRPGIVIFIVTRHRPDIGQTSARHRPDIGQTSARHRPDIGQTSARHRPDIGQTSNVRQ